MTASNCNAIKFGTASHGGYRNIAVSNCVVRRAAEDNIRHWSKQLEHISADVTVISGVAIEMVDGGIIDGITVSNISMRDVQTPIFIRLGDRHRTFRKEGGVLKNINISNVVATAESLIACSITGVEGSYVENVSINNVQISYPGGGTPEMVAKQVPEMTKSYPENRMFGNTLPAAGFMSGMPGMYVLIMSVLRLRFPTSVHFSFWMMSWGRNSIYVREQLLLMPDLSVRT